MYLIQILLPLYRNDGQALPRALFRQVRDELIERFGGLTAYPRAPASGYWQEDPQAPPNHDDSVIYEVMAARLERDVCIFRQRTYALSNNLPFLLLQK